MADISDVEDALCMKILGIVYPNGVDAGSLTGVTVKIYRGWPTSKTLNADLLAGTQTVTVFSRKDSSRDTSRYPRIWRTIAINAPGIAVSVSGNIVTLSGLASSGQTVAILVDGVVYTYSPTNSDTLSSVATGLAELIPGTVASGASIQVSFQVSLQARVAGSGVAEMETRRQEQGFTISVWCPTPTGRDALSLLIDRSLSDTDWLPLSDQTVGRVIYHSTEEVDASENANLYRRNLSYTVEYPTTIQMNAAQMLFGIGVLSGNGRQLGFDCVRPAHDEIAPPLGAIRFDAWYDPANTIDQQCATALSPPAYWARLPCNAIISNGLASWPTATQATIDFEISAALVAGLSFWAFDSYQPDDTLSLALQLYLSSSLRSKLKFCMLGQSSNWGQGGRDQPSLLRDIAMMTQPGYMTVLNDRPLYFVLDASSSQLSGLPTGGVATAISFVRSQVQAAGGGNPYVIWLSGAAFADYLNIGVAQAVGADAAGAYCTPRLNGAVQPASALFAAAEADWAARVAADYPMIPTAMTGWDQRPLIQTPQAFYPIAAEDSVQNYYQAPSDPELRHHIVALSHIIGANAEACPAQVGLIYAWNELAEGGWLVPTYTQGGADMERVATVGSAVAASVKTSSTFRLKFIA